MCVQLDARRLSQRAAKSRLNAAGTAGRRDQSRLRRPGHSLTREHALRRDGRPAKGGPCCSRYTGDYELDSPRATRTLYQRRLMFCAIAVVAYLGERFVKVHILEDDAGVNESLRTLLQAFGYTVTSHENAASFFLAQPPSADELVIIDLGLPDIDGASVVRWVEKLSTPPRVIVISGQPQRLIDRALKDVPNITVLRKPLSGESLMPLLS